MDTLTSQTDTKILTVCLLDVGVKTGFRLTSLTGWQPTDRRPSSSSCCCSSSPRAGGTEGQEPLGAGGTHLENRGSERRPWEGDDKGRVSSPPRLECGANFLLFLSFFYRKTTPDRKPAATCSKEAFSRAASDCSPLCRGQIFFPPQSLDSKAAEQLYLPGTIITTVGGVAGRQSKRCWKRKWRHHPAPQTADVKFCVQQAEPKINSSQFYCDIFCGIKTKTFRLRKCVFINSVRPWKPVEFYRKIGYGLHDPEHRLEAGKSLPKTSVSAVSEDYIEALTV